MKKFKLISSLTFHLVNLDVGFFIFLVFPLFDIFTIIFVSYNRDPKYVSKIDILVGDFFVILSLIIFILSSVHFQNRKKINA